MARNSSSSFFQTPVVNMKGLEEGRRLKEFQCGDPVELKRLVSRFLKRSSMHGAVYMTSGRSKFSTWSWRLLMAICVTATLFSIVTLSMDALTTENTFIKNSFKPVTAVERNNPMFPVYPAITICAAPNGKFGDNVTMYEFSRFVFTALGFPFVSLTHEELGIILGVSGDEAQYNSLDEHLEKSYTEYLHIKKETANFSLRELIFNVSLRCEEMFISCVLYIHPVNCCELFTPILTLNGPCFTLNLGYAALHDLIQKATISGFPLIIDMQSPIHSQPMAEMGFRVFLSHPLYGKNFLDPTEAILVASGFSTSITTNLVLINRRVVFEAWHGLSDSCPRLPSRIQKNKVLQSVYLRNNCFMKNVALYIEKKCNCTWIVDTHKDDDQRLRVCEPLDMLDCGLKSTTVISSPEVLEMCKKPCTEYTYDSYTSNSKIGSENGSRIIIKYKSSAYVLNEYSKNTISSFLSQIGGSLGLYLGASIFTVIEVTVFIAFCVWYRLKPTRVSKNVEHNRHFFGELRKRF